jgi:hypothetical protein
MRSGTTLLNRLLNAHPEVAMIYHPTRFFDQPKALAEGGVGAVLDRFRTQYGYFVNLDAATRARVDAALAELPAQPPAGDAYRALTGALAGPGPRVVGEKYAGRGAEMHPFHLHLPEGKVVMITRDPRDVLLSNRKRVEQEVDADSFWRGAHLLALDDWAHLAVLHRSFDQIQGGTYLHLRYEDLVADPEAASRALCSFLGVPFAPQMLAEGALRHDDGREWRANTSHGEAYRGVSDRSVARYREGLSEGELLLVNALLADHLKFFGYAADRLEPDTEALVEAGDLFLTLGRALAEYGVTSAQLYAVQRTEEDNLLWFMDKAAAVLGAARKDFVRGFLAGRRVTVREGGFRLDQAAERLAVEIVALRRSMEWMPSALQHAVEDLAREIKNVRAAVDRFPTPLNVVKRAIRKPPQ